MSAKTIESKLESLADRFTGPADAETLIAAIHQYQSLKDISSTFKLPPTPPHHVLTRVNFAAADLLAAKANEVGVTGWDCIKAAVQTRLTVPDKLSRQQKSEIRIGDGAVDILARMIKAKDPGVVDLIDEDLEARNKWLYEERIKGVAWKKLTKVLDKKAGAENWESIGQSAIRDAVKSHAKKHNLPLPVGKRGRPKKIAVHN
jgi:hypothetical protein